MNLTVRDVSRELDVSEDTIRRWDKKGLIKSSRNELNYRVFDLDEVRRLQAKLNGTGNSNKYKILKTNTKTQYSAIELFAGAGGTALGLENAGINHLLLNEIDKDCSKTLKANFPQNTNIVCEDVKKLNFTEFKDKVDIVQAGFPCQAFSYAGKSRGFEDTRGTLFFNIANIVKQKIETGNPPKVLFLENVKGLKSHMKGETLKTILATLDELGYAYNYEVLNAKYFGVPQNRERLFIIAWYKRLVKVDTFRFPYGISPNGDTIYEKTKDLAEKVIKTKVSDIFEPEKTMDEYYTISDRMWIGHQRRKERNRANGKGFGYSLFNSDSVYCSTISARYWKDGSEILIDQSDKGLNPRRLTPVEAGRLQGYRILGNGWQNPECADNDNYNSKNPEFKIRLSNLTYPQFIN